MLEGLLDRPLRVTPSALCVEDVCDGCAVAMLVGVVRVDEDIGGERDLASATPTPGKMTALSAVQALLLRRFTLTGLLNAAANYYTSQTFQSFSYLLYNPRFPSFWAYIGAPCSRTYPFPPSNEKEPGNKFETNCGLVGNEGTG